MEAGILSKDAILLNASFRDKWEAIRMSGQLLVDTGAVTQDYIEEMLEREKSATVYIGSNVAIPHGISTDEHNIIHSGISFIQVPNGVLFGDELAFLIIGIAGKNGSHIELLGKIALSLTQDENIAFLRQTQSKEDVVRILVTNS